MKRSPLPAWFILTFLVTLFANLLGIVTTVATFPVMGGVSDFALAVRAHTNVVSSYYNPVAFTTTGAIIVRYLLPIVRHLRQPGNSNVPEVVQRRVLSAPLVIAFIGLGAWAFGCILFPLATLYQFGRWSTELVSPEIVSPLVSGFLAATTTYLLVDWVFRTIVIPRVFPDGRIPALPGAITLGVRGRLLVFLMAVAFTPLFTMLGLARAAVVRVESGVDASAVMAALQRGSTITFAVYVALGIGLTLVLARSLIRPLGAMAATLRRVEAGDLTIGVTVNSADEVGVLATGVNTMVAALRDNARILQTFGRVVDPTVRDRLLAGTLELGGEVRTASVLFCDMRGFTTIAEHSSPGEVVTMLNSFFTVMTAWVRECGGFVDKFIGDALLVVFGLFDTDTSTAHAAAAALRCALGMRQRLADLNAVRGTLGQFPLAMTVGIDSGEVLAGKIGALDRHDYTVIGDTVNVAARLQELCKELDHDLLVSARTVELAQNGGGCGAEVTLRTTVTLRGRREPVDVVGLA